MAAVSSLVFIAASLCLASAVQSPSRPNNLTQAVIWSAESDSTLNVSSGVMYYKEDKPGATLGYFGGYSLGRLAYNYDNRTIYFSGLAGSRREIFELYNDGSDPIPIRIETGDVGGLAYDWLAENIYFTDTSFKWVRVLTTGTKTRRARVVIEKNGSRVPGGIAVSPPNGYLFLSDIGTAPKIERASLSGENLKTIVNGSALGRVTSLVVDEAGKRIYWADGAKQRIGSSDFNGGKQRFINTNTNVQYIALLGNRIAALDNATKSVRMYDKDNGTIVSTYSVPGMTGERDILGYAKSNQPGSAASSRCSSKGCTHFCVSGAESSARCMCSDGYTLQKDGKSCKIVMPVIVWSEGGDIDYMPLVGSYKGFLGFNVSKNQISALTYDAAGLQIFFADSKSAIYSLPMLDTPESKIKRILQANGTITGMAYDWINGNLYWANSQQNTIVVASLKDASQKVFLSNVSDVRGIAVEPKQGVLFWSTKTPAPSIQRIDLTGKNRQTFVSSNITDPRGVAVDYSEGRLYWIEGNLNGGYGVFTVNLTNPADSIVAKKSAYSGTDLTRIAVYKDYIYVTNIKPPYSGIFAMKKANYNTPPWAPWTNFYFARAKHTDIMACDPSLQPAK